MPSSDFIEHFLPGNFGSSLEINSENISSFLAKNQTENQPKLLDFTVVQNSTFKLIFNFQQPQKLIINLNLQGQAKISVLVLNLISECNLEFNISHHFAGNELNFLQLNNLNFGISNLEIKEQFLSPGNHSTINIFTLATANSQFNFLASSNDCGFANNMEIRHKVWQSDWAKVNSKPSQFVSCAGTVASHGISYASNNKPALKYLRARGCNLQSALNLLKLGFFSSTNQHLDLKNYRSFLVPK